ncbi:MAG: hypothetical protein IIB22_08295, partial [Chloroflexi bacterium]|nr:hypothetical protein [Chloroflexota bacterium]
MVAGTSGSDDKMTSLGKFQIEVHPAFQPLMAGYPGYDATEFTLTSPTLHDPNTVVGRSVYHLDGDTTDAGGAIVGSAKTIISDSTFSLVPAFEGPPGSREIHTEIRELNLKAGAVAVRAGIDAPDQPISPGEVESKDPTGASDFPADSFFNVFVEVDLPAVASFPGGTLFNSSPLLVVNEDIISLPPKVVYRHGNSSAVPVYFKTTSVPFWTAGDLFGWLVLAGHGAGFDDSPEDIAEFEQIYAKEVEPFPLPINDVNDGNLAGVSDILVGSVNTGAGLFYCIAKTDHESATNAITTYLQCNIDIEGAGVAPTTNTPPSWSDTCVTLSERTPPECVPGQLNNPSETGADALAGPPPPPPYTSLAPSIGRGFFYPGGVGAPPSALCDTTDCTVVTSCFEDVGPIKGTGPNIISTAVILDPKGEITVQADTDGDTVKDTQVDRVSNGFVDIWYNQSNQSCTDLMPKGEPDFDDLPLQSIQVNDKGGTNVNPNPAPWRPGPKPGATTIDFDGDGCTDEQELDPKAIGKCG